MRGQVYLLRDMENGYSSIYEDAADAVAFMSLDQKREFTKGHKANLTRLLRQGVAVSLGVHFVKQHKLITKGRLY